MKEDKKIKILFFIGSLASGGKERRLLELLTYLGRKKEYELILVTKKTEILFDNFFDLNIEWIQMTGYKIGIKTFLEFFKIAQNVKPDIIHTWGSMQTLITLPYLFLNQRTKLLNSQITSAPPKLSGSERLISIINFHFSDIILSNSIAGIEAYKPPKSKSQVIYNGLNFNRFKNLIPSEEIKSKFSLNHKFTIIMVASYSPNKDFLRFFRVGISLTKLRKDVKFIGVGFFKGGGEEIFEECVKLTANYPNLVPMPGNSQVESLVNACDIGVLLSNTKVHGEGISNAIIEYMALGKPVIANDAGGTKEILKDGYNGLLIKEESDDEIAKKINLLLNDPQKMETMGCRSKKQILEEFSLATMGGEFEKVYKSFN